MKLTSFFTKRSLIVFFLNVACAFLMSAIPHLNLSFQQSLASPFVQTDIMDQIKVKLEGKETNFHLKREFFPSVQAGSEYENASAYGVIDLDTGEVIAQKNFSEKLPIASLTKVMTAVVALDLASKDEEFRVSFNASSQIPTKVMLKEGEKYPLEELINSLLLSSANDSAEVIKEGVDEKYKEEVFLKSMNLKAQFLGLKNSHFTNPQGFDDPEHYSSVEDLSILSNYALENYPLIAAVVKKDIANYTRGWTDRRFYFQNWNGLLGVYPGVSGVKIGNTDEAGVTTIVSSEREDKRVLVVLLGAPGVIERDLWTGQLLDLGFEKLGIEAVNVGEEQLREKYASWIYFK